MTPSSARIPSLDGLRGIAVLVVIAAHLIWQDAALGAVDRVLFNGWVGVDLFFVLSGFLITGILCDTRDNPAYFRRFYLRRSLRIFPIHYLLLVILFVVAPLVLRLRHEYMSHAYRYLVLHQEWYWTYMVNVLQAIKPQALDTAWIGHLWTLSIEEQFYLLWPAVVWLVPRRRLPLVCIVLIAGAALARVWLTAGELPFMAFMLMPTRMDSLAAGALVAALLRTEPGPAVLRRWYPIIGGIAWIGAIAVHAAFGAMPLSGPMLSIGLLANSLAGAALVAALVDGRHRWLDWVATRRLRDIGRISYGMYLYHLPLITLLIPVRVALHSWGAGSAGRDLVAHLLWMVIGYSATIVVAAVSYRLVEAPLLALKERWSGSVGPAAVSAPPYALPPSRASSLQA